MKLSKSSIVLIVVLGLFLIYMFGQSESSLEIVDFSLDKPETQSPSISSNEDRNPYYGDLHVHTKYSFDAYVFGITATPCLLYTSPSPRDLSTSRMPSSA